jgi:hypothetical protein
MKILLHLPLKAALALALAGSSLNTSAQDRGEAAYNFLYDYPQEATDLGWNEEAQGLAHDAANWFVTQRNAIWKIPVTHDLNADASGAPGVMRHGIEDYPVLWSRGYNHFGDPELYSTNGQEYLFVPVVGFSTYEPRPDPTPPPIIAVFRARDLEYLTHSILPGGFDEHHVWSGVSGESWCAFDSKGHLFVPNTVASFGAPFSLEEFEVNFDALEAIPRGLYFRAEYTVALYDEAGAPVDLNKDYHQGGAISPREGLLYLSNGGDVYDSVLAYFKTLGYSDYVARSLAAIEFDRQKRNMGLHVFDLRTGRRVARSNTAHRPFICQFDPSWPSDEPEGMTYWDLDNDGIPHDPHVGGQLHALILENDAGDDDVYVKHYTSAIYVDRAYLDAEHEHGIPVNPFNTVTEGNTYAWDGADLRIKTGHYPETVTFSKRMHIVADGGPVTIGR